MFYGPMAERLGKGLQNPEQRFNSASDLTYSLWSPVAWGYNREAAVRILPRWRNGIRSGLKIRGLYGHESSSLSRGT